jgi:hypothetical protein
MISADASSLGARPKRPRAPAPRRRPHTRDPIATRAVVAFRLLRGSQGVHIAAQARILGPQLQRAPHARNGILEPPGARLQPAKFFGQARIVGQAHHGLVKDRPRSRHVATAFKRIGLIENQRGQIRAPAQGFAVEPRHLGQIATPARGGGQLAQDPDVGLAHALDGPKRRLCISGPAKAVRKTSASASCTSGRRRVCPRTGQTSAPARTRPCRILLLAGQRKLRLDTVRVEGNGLPPARCGRIVAPLAAPKPADFRQHACPLLVTFKRGQRAFQGSATVVLFARHAAHEQQRFDGQGRDAWRPALEPPSPPLSPRPAVRCPQTAPEKGRAHGRATPAPRSRPAPVLPDLQQLAEIAHLRPPSRRRLRRQPREKEPPRWS